MYAEAYLTNRIERQPDGWPVFVDQAGKEWLTARVKSVLSNNGPLIISTVVYWVWRVYAGEPKPECLQHVALIDAQYAAVHRALIAAGAEQVWVLPNS